MVSNDIVVPLVLQRREAIARRPRRCRRACCSRCGGVAIFVILLLAYMYYRSAGDAQLASIGLLVVRRHRAARAGILRRPDLAARAPRAARIAGMTVGILVWAYTLLLPSFADAGIVGADILTRGPVRHRRAAAAGACSGSTCRRCVHGVLWSLTLNIVAYVGVLAGARRPPRSSGCRPTCSCRRSSRRSRRASGCGAPRSRSRN